MLRQAIDRIDHIAILVYPENIQKYVDKLSRVFGISFSEASRNDNVGVIAAVSWDSGLEILAPTEEGGEGWKRLEKAGEGNMIIVFGVADLDAGMRRAEENGVGIAYEVKMTGEEPWRDRFRVFREAMLENIFETTFVLSQIEPNTEPKIHGATATAVAGPTKLRQAVNRIDHIAILVYPENIEKYVDKLSRVFGITFSEPSRNDHVGIIAAVSWDSGLEILAPTDKTSENWKRLEKVGEGTMTIVFGVEDIDAAMRRAEENGVGIAYEVKVTGEEPWVDRFKVFREAKLEKIFETTFVLSQIEPKY